LKVSLTKRIFNYCGVFEFWQVAEFCEMSADFMNCSKLIIGLGGLARSECNSTKALAFPFSSSAISKALLGLFWSN
jgi:hypothetical protein